MKKWEAALDKFIEKWKERKEVVGAIACGSYITGNPSRHSDIDVHIILDKRTKWRERGNEIIDGILIEYFANPARMHKDYADDDHRKRRKINAHMFATGKILFDRTGEVKKLVSDAKKQILKKYLKPDRTEIELDKYQLWDMRDNLEEMFESGREGSFLAFYVYLKELLEIYSKFLQFDSIPVHKTWRFLADEGDKKKYLIRNFPDARFVKMFLTALKAKNDASMMKEYRELTDYVMRKMGGFNINGWKIKTPAKTTKKRGL